MERVDEIKELLKHLLGKTENKIDKNQYSKDYPKIVGSARKVVSISKDIEKYLKELEELGVEL